MKQYVNLLSTLLCLLITYHSPLMAQKKAVAAKHVIEKEDTILMLNGESKHGKINGVGSDVVLFVHSGEKLEYSLKKTEIQKIIFASGRTELITAPAVAKSASDDYPPKVDNLIAILPFKYRSVGEALEQINATKEKLQDDTYSFLSKRNGIYKFQDPQTTNALLIRKGIDENTIKGYTFDELCKILGTEFIVQGGLSRSSKENIASAETKTATKDDDRIRQNKAGSTVVQKTYENELSVLIYNRQNEKVFDNHRTAILSSEASYKDALFYMLKRCPMYNK
ncbi:hypothetical protein [Chitinophaga arvensicola]|uniref:Uncharacterized protein n=1 Tax=Chitinophaga arvensicola TaxID=29529 RepID=A0A1I0RH16_9BACT|nr:hypothetical protein [Chitinophaga arvensicola]SEW40174.1 hypothetical protein SAMN04488122_2826 [Chitinophaga arvensicola]